MKMEQIIQTRFSVRSYRPDPVEPQKLEAVLNAAVLAPTAVNLQAFQILVISTKGREEQLQRIYKQGWFVQAPYVIGVCVRREQCYIRRYDAKNFADIDAAIVMDHIILSATAQGLGTCWVGAFDPVAAREVLQLPADLEPIVFTPLGYTDAVANEKKRKAKEELIVFYHNTDENG